MLVDRASGLKKCLCQTFNQPKSESSHYSSYSYYFCICRKRYRTYELTTRSRYQEQGKVITSHGIAITCHCRWYSLLTHKDTILSSTRQWHICEFIKTIGVSDVLVYYLSQLYTWMFIVMAIVCIMFNEAKRVCQIDDPYKSTITQKPWRINYPYETSWIIEWLMSTSFYRQHMLKDHCISYIYIYTLGKKGCYTPGWCVFFVIISISSLREV